MKVYAKTIKFKNIAKNPTLLGFGCMRFPVKENTNEIDEDLSFQMIDYAYQSGVTYFDTAYPYHQGQSEILLGKALKRYPRETFNLATKMPTWDIKSKEDAERIFNEQLAKCQVEYFDFYLCHALNKENFLNYKIPGVMDFLYQMREEGKIRHLGFSFHDTPEALNDIIHSYSFDFVMIQLNYLDWTYQRAKEQYEIIKESNLPVLVMEPVRGGTLADLGEEANAVFKQADQNASIASWALRYAASLPQVMTVLSGMSTMEHVKDNIKTFTDFKPLNHYEEATVQTALDTFLKSRIVPCTDCKYCMECPFGVDIPGTFKIYNHYAIGKNERSFYNSYLKLNPNGKNLCVKCKKCVSKCPQKIDIPTQLERIQKFFDEIMPKYKE